MKWLLIVLVSCMMICSCGEPELIARGVFERVEYLQTSFNTSDKTVVHFEDGSTYVMRGTRSMPPGIKGKVIEIYERIGIGRYNIIVK